MKLGYNIGLLCVLLFADIRSEESLANDTTPQRLARMRRVCESSRELREKKGPVYSNLMADLIFNTITCVPAKVSSTDWKYLMFKLHMFKYPRPQRAVKLHKATTLGEVNITYFSDHNQKERDTLLKTYYKYVVVRHPWTRLVAGYKERFVDTDMEFVGIDTLIKQIKSGFDPLGESGTSRVLFHEYIQYVLSLSSAPAEMDRRWMPMRYACEPCLVKYDFIVKLENLDLDMLSLFYAINVTGHKIPYFGSIVKPDDSVSKIMPYFVNVSESDYMQLSHFYRQDFELYGYTVPRQHRPSLEVAGEGG